MKNSWPRSADPCRGILALALLLPLLHYAGAAVPEEVAQLVRAKLNAFITI
jgi:hypothetical protein